MTSERYAKWRLWHAEYRKKNPEKIKAWRKKSESKPDIKAKKAAYQREWYEKKREHSREYHRQYYWKNKEKKAAWFHAAHARRKNAPGIYDEHDIKRLFRIQNQRCYYCCIVLTDKWEVDHMVPLTKGGTNYPVNIRITCMSCNRRKHDKSVMDFMLTML